MHPTTTSAVRRRRPRGGPAARTLATALAVALTASACSGEPTDRDATPRVEQTQPTGGPEATTPTPRVATAVSMGRVTGTVSRAQRRQAKARVAAAVDDWIDGAFATGDYPRTAFPRAFASFTDRAQRRARADRGVVSNLVVGSRMQEVEATRRRVEVDLLGVGGRAVGATARVAVTLEMTRTPQAQQAAGSAVVRQRIGGRMLLARSGRAPTWKVFGYDLTRGVVR